MMRSTSLPRGLRLAALLATSLLLAAGCSGSDDPPPGGDPDAGTPDAGLPAAPPALPPDTARVHFFRMDANYDGWGLHLWGDGVNTPRVVAWTNPWSPAGQYLPGCGPWLYFDVPIKPGATGINFILHQGDTKSVPEDMLWSFAATGGQKEVYQVLGDPTLHTTRPEVSCKDLGSVAEAKAHWVDRATIVWPLGTVPEADLAAQKFRLYHAPAGGITVNAETGAITGGTAVDLAFTRTRYASTTRFPHLQGEWTLSVPEAARAGVPGLLRGQVLVARFDAQDKLLYHTALQLPGVLDDLYAAAAADAKLGVTWASGSPVFRVWAPTAQSVALLLYASPTATEATRHAMVRDDATGVWSYTGAAADDRKSYLFEVKVYAPTTRQVETNLVTDPYSLGLSQDSARSLVLDLDAPDLAPTGWASLSKPPLAQPEDVSIYELHVRDFSFRDLTVPEAHRGKFKAFTASGSNGMAHLRGLAQAGLTHLHLLPVFDIATIPEDPAARTEPDWAAMSTAVAGDRASEVPQQLVTQRKDSDGFNWGYDPLHYTVPEGSYATDAQDGAVRVREFRELVQAVNGAGLRVVMDVVYNHTAAAGQSARSVLDRVVPGYYHRLDEKGAVANSTCCANTATEHAMMRKLMVDSLVTWATKYKVDAFRFDLMGHHMKADMLEVKQRLAALTPGTDGVDGAKIYLYGEGWNFGEVQDGKRGVNATQINLQGTGIGTFNDRLRDAVRGGGPFDSGAALQSNQGFINGLFTDPNVGAATGDAAKAKLLELSDLVRVGMTGNLAEYRFTNFLGNSVLGFHVTYNGQQAGYTKDPQEAITYVSKHDNQTLYDINAYKLPAATPMAERVRVQNLGMSIVALGQGVPFFHAGDDTLRSKSLDRDSYNSGDWFNRLDWTYTDNNWGVGAPVAEKNQENWSIIKPLLTGIAKPAQADIQRARDHLREVLAVRASSRLFRLGTEAQVKERLRFHNTGPQQVPGLLVLSVVDGTGADDLDPDRQAVVVLVNATKAPQTFTDAAFASATLALHPALAGGTDAVVKTSTFSATGTAGTFTVPARTTAVFAGSTGLTLDRP